MSSQKFQFVSHSKKGRVELTNQSQKEVQQSLCNKFQTQFKIYLHFCCNCSGNYREAYALVNSFEHKKCYQSLEEHFLKETYRCEVFAD